jgi:hypothetical protein
MFFPRSELSQHLQASSICAPSQPTFYLSLLFNRMVKYFVVQVHNFVPAQDGMNEILDFPQCHVSEIPSDGIKPSLLRTTAQHMRIQ